MNRLLSLPVIVTAIAVLFFIILAAWVDLGISIAIDIDGLVWLAANSSALATTVFRIITWAGSILFLAPLVILVGYILSKHHYRQDAMVLTSSLVTAAVIARLLKYVIARERPDVYPALVDTYTQLAFPSAHATQICAFCLALYIILKRRRLAWHVVAGLALFAVAVAVMFSRLYLQVHYPSDVIGGALLGIICVLSSSMIFAKTTKD